MRREKSPILWVVTSHNSRRFHRPISPQKSTARSSIRKADLSWTRRHVFSRPAALHCRTSLPEAARRAVSQGLPRGDTCLEMDCCRRRGSSPRSPDSTYRARFGRMEMKRVLVIVPFAMSDDEIGRRKDQLKAVKLGADMEFHFR